MMLMMMMGPMTMLIMELTTQSQGTVIYMKVHTETHIQSTHPGCNNFTSSILFFLFFAPFHIVGKDS